jgi:serine/threonine-protein kinase HipA
MIGTTKISVSICFDLTEIKVGELVSDNKRIYFKYDADFIELGINISPFKLLINSKIQVTDQLPFDGLFGVFADSLPEGWGRLLLDRKLISKGIPIVDINPLDRLSFVGEHGMGALIYRPITEEQIITESILDLDRLAHEMNVVLSGTSSDLLDELYELGGSSGGARPKILIAYNPDTDHILTGHSILPQGYSHWIIKFPSSFDRIDIAEIEFAYYKMALDSGLTMSESLLFKSKSGKHYFGTKRFDRIHNSRLHLHSAAGLMHDNFRLSTLDYGHLMDCAFKLERHVGAYENILRLATFNVFSHNRDDHSKNFSFLMDKQGTWKFAPVYDLTFSSSGHGMHSTSVAGESKQPGIKHLLELANYFKIRQPERIIQEVRDVLTSWKTYADLAGVESDSKKLIGKILI